MNFFKNETSFFQKPKSLNIETIQGRGGGGRQSKLLSILEAKGKQNYKINVHRTVVFVLDLQTLDCVNHKVCVYLEYHSVCPLVGIGTHIPSPASECALPSELKGREGYTVIHTRLRVRGWGSSNSDDWRENLVLCLLRGVHRGS